jgi:hypothetical protein
MKTQAMNEMLDVAPERHVHIKGNTIYTTVHPAGTADSLRRDYMVARKALEMAMDDNGYLLGDEDWYLKRAAKALQ